MKKIFSQIDVYIILIVAIFLVIKKVFMWESYIWTLILVNTTICSYKTKNKKTILAKTWRVLSILIFTLYIVIKSIKIEGNYILIISSCFLLLFMLIQFIDIETEIFKKNSYIKKNYDKSLAFQYIGVYLSMIIIIYNIFKRFLVLIDGTVVNHIINDKLIEYLAWTFALGIVKYENSIIVNILFKGIALLYDRGINLLEKNKMNFEKFNPRLIIDITCSSIFIVEVMLNLQFNHTDPMYSTPAIGSILTLSITDPIVNQIKRSISLNSEKKSKEIA